MRFSTISHICAFALVFRLESCEALSNLHPERSARPQQGTRSRREWFRDAAVAFTLVGNAFPSMAEETAVAQPLEMKTFVDSLFSLVVPKTFYTLRRTQKGDLPDQKTGKGRRGSSIFTAGNMAKAEVIAVEVSITKRTKKLPRRGQY